MFSSRLSFADTTNALSKAKAERLAAGLPVLDLSDSNPANAGFAWSAADLGPLLRRDGDTEAPSVAKPSAPAFRPPDARR